MGLNSGTRHSGGASKNFNKSKECFYENVKLIVLNRSYNKMSHPTPFSSEALKLSKSSTVEIPDFEDVLIEDEQVDQEEEEEEEEQKEIIKPVKPKAKKASSSKTK